jgi:hypothetical protein
LADHLADPTRGTFGNGRFFWLLQLPHHHPDTLRKSRPRLPLLADVLADVLTDVLADVLADDIEPRSLRSRNRSARR